METEQDNEFRGRSKRSCIGGTQQSKRRRFECEGTEAQIQFITRSMKVCPESLILQLEGCHALRRRIQHDGCKQRYFFYGWEVEALDVVIDAIGHHAPWSRHTCYLGFDVIRMLVTSSQLCRKAASNNISMLTTALRLMELYSNDPAILQVGLSILSWVVEETEGRDAILDLGGIELLLIAIEQHPEDVLIQCNCTASLSWLIHTQSSKAKSAMAAGSKGIGLLIDTLKRFHLSDPSIFGNIVCSLIGTLIAEPSRQDFQSAEIVATAVRGMEQHQSSPRVRRNSLTLLRLLTIDTPVGQALVLPHIESVRLAMSQAVDDCDALEEACGILANVCILPEGRSAVLETGCVDTVVFSQLSSRSQRLQLFAVLFHSLLVNDGVGETSLAFGGGQDVIYSMLAGTSQLQRENDTT